MTKVRRERQGEVCPGGLQGSGARKGGEGRTGQQCRLQAGRVMGHTASSRAGEQDRAGPSEAGWRGGVTPPGVGGHTLEPGGRGGCWRTAAGAGMANGRIWEVSGARERWLDNELIGK